MCVNFMLTWWCFLRRKGTEKFLLKIAWKFLVPKFVLSPLVPVLVATFFVASPVVTVWVPNGGFEFDSLSHTEGNTDSVAAQGREDGLRDFRGFFGRDTFSDAV
jgi:hypothetical protein